MREVVIEFFQSENIPLDSAGDVLRASFSGENGRFQSFVKVDEATGVVAVYSVSPVSAPPERLAAACELVARLNYGHRLGNLELDVDTGELRMKTAIDVEGEELSEGLVANLVYGNVASLDQMLPALVACLTKGAAPVDAVKALSGS